MQSPKLTYDKNELVIRKEAWINLILGFPAISLLTIGLFFHKETKPFFIENPLVTLASIVIIIAALYFLVHNSLDRRIKMAINKEGIWIAKKGLLSWSNLQYYYFEEITSDYDTTSLLKIKLLEPAKEVKVDISFFNTSEQEIEQAIERNSGEYKIIALKKSY